MYFQGGQVWPQTTSEEEKGSTDLGQEVLGEDRRRIGEGPGPKLCGGYNGGCTDGA